jgi:2-methylfumaryl-CoA isomerase
MADQAGTSPARKLPGNSMHALLSSITVIEGASFIAGPSCALHLAQMGARVIRFDMIGGGPDFRRWPLAPSGGSLYWEGLNKGKLSVALDLSKAEGRELAAELVTAPGANRGLFVTNYPADGFLSHEKLAARRTDLITLRVTGWPDGRNGVDYTINAAIGVPLMTGPADLPGDQPVNSVLPAWDLLAGAYGAFALLAAERRRRETGVGGEIRIALSDVAAGSLSHMGQVAEALLTGDRPRGGNATFGAFGRDFKTADGKNIMIVAITPRQWSGLLAALAVEGEIAALEAELGTSFRSDEGMRYAHRDRLFAIIGKAVARFTLAEIAPLLDQHGACWEPYQSLREAIEHDPRFVRGNSMFANLAQPSGLEYPAAGPFARITGEEAASPSPAPRLGAHTEEVLAHDLGLPAHEIARLHDTGIVASAS